MFTHVGIYINDALYVRAKNIGSVESIYALPLNLMPSVNDDTQGPMEFFLLFLSVDFSTVLSLIHSQTNF